MRVLVIEDEHKIANAVKKGLQHESYAVDVAYDGVSGYDMASVEQYDVIILDVMIPGMDGIDMCKKLREHNIHTPILMLTSKSQIEDKVVGFEKNAQPEPGVRTANLKRYVSPEAVEKVLEVPAGTVERLGIQVGEQVVVNY